jgi:hypothetical protein
MIKMTDINKIRHHIMVENKTLFYSIMVKRLKKNGRKTRSIQCK